MSTPYGMPPSAPQPPSSPQPPAPPQKSRTGLYIGIGCGCVLLLLLVLAVIGAGVWLYSGSDPEEPTAGPSTSESSTEDPSEDPTDEPTDEETTEPIESEDPSEEPSETPHASFEVNVSAPEEGTTLDIGTETLETENGKFIGVELTISNNGNVPLGLTMESFAFFGADGEEYNLRHAQFSTFGEIEPGEQATVQLFADVPVEMELATVTYTDEVATQGKPFEMPVG